MFFYQNTVVKPSTEPEDDEGLLRPPERERLEGPHERPRRRRGGRPPRGDGARIQTPNTDDQAELDDTQKFLLSIRKGVTTISSFGYINDASAGKIILSQGWNGDVRRILKARKKEGDITAVLPDREVRGVGRQLVHPGHRAAPGGGPRVDQLAARADHGGHGDEVPQLSDPDPRGARSDARRDFKNDPMFNVPSTYTDNYQYILNPNPQLVNARTKIYQQFKAA